MSSRPLFEELPLGRHLAVLTRLYYGALTQKLAHLEIDRYYSVLMYIDRSPDKVTQQMVGDFLHIDKTSMVRVIDFLTERDYVKRIPNAEDRRSYVIALTDHGRSILPDIDAAVADLNERVMAGLTEEERAQFHQSLCRISSNLKEMPSDEIIIDFQPNPNKLKRTL